MAKLHNGQVLARFDLTTITGQPVQIPDPDRLVHLQFRRFAGCPICNLHLRSITRRHDEIVAAGVREVAVFHSTAAAMQPYQGDLPFATIADPDRRLYVRFGVDASPWAVLHPRTWIAALRGVAAGNAAPPAQGESALGLPADFLIGTDGRVLAHKYGRHADDQWSVDELLHLALRRSHRTS
ncbi:peroxiredoxin-like family protein [Verrucosispora sp. WMMA2044]|uniref:peroxiredoxin-like family protein n=1 Tax=Verrucosispora sp. WMMA2044 TaxID=3016419 RepID=UPI00248C4FB0|nr:peroxiredoxin-like family protein [Verrucosispora sp. WMMA2044]WBB48573.1 peroxiredoxin-like family protein [Verrucosispora sp. WMMA2044]